MFGRYLICTIITVGLEFPRYVDILICGKYTSQWAYSLHLLGSSCYFVTFSLVIFSMGEGLIGLHDSNKLLKGLVISNALFAVIVILAIEQCLTAYSLRSFFDEPFYIFFSVCDVAKNSLFGMVVLFKAVRNLINTKRFIYSLNRIIVEQGAPSSSANADWTVEHKRKKIVRQLNNIIRLLIALNICLLLRATTLSIKMYLFAFKDDKQNIGSLRLYGQLWSMLDDLIPRGTPLILFLFAQFKFRKRAPPMPNYRTSAVDSIFSISTFSIYEQRPSDALPNATGSSDSFKQYCSDGTELSIISISPISNSSSSRGAPQIEFD